MVRRQENIRQGPLPSLDVCFKREKEFAKPPVWVFFLPSGPRNEDGDLPNRAASDLALVLAYAVAMRIDNDEREWSHHSWHCHKP